MGVTVSVVTGDALAITKETAEQVGLGSNILEAARSLGDVKHSDRGL